MRPPFSILLLLSAWLASGGEPGPATARAAGAGPVGLRQPALSPDGGTIVFAWRGDLWRVPFEGGMAEAVTRTPEDERRPLFARSGATLIYASASEGNFDLFARDLSGGSPRRLTWDEADDFPCDTSPDDALVLFQSRRAGGELRLHEVPLRGGEVRELTFDSASEGRYSPDGARIAFVHGGVGWWRKGYRGSANNDLWLLEREGREATRITSFAGSDLWPLWLPDGRSLLCVSEETIVANLFRLRLESGERERLTSHTGDGVRFPSISRDGKRVVYEESGRILALELDPPGGEAREVAIAFAEWEPAVEIDTLRAGAEELAVAAGRVVLGLEGDLFLLGAGGVMTNLTASPARDREPSLSSDGRTLFFASDRSGNYDLFRIDLEPVVRGGAAEPRPFRAQREDERAPKLSPDGRMVAYLRTFNGDELRLADAEGGRDRLLALGPRIESFAWSPDGRWLAFSRADDAGRFDLFLLAPWGEEEINVTRHPAQDLSPAWSADGSALYFLSDRDGGRGIWKLPLGNPSEAAGNEGTPIDFDGIIWRAEPVATIRPVLRFGRGTDHLWYLSESGRDGELFIQPDGGNPLRVPWGGATPRAVVSAATLWLLDREGRLGSGPIGEAPVARPFAVPLRRDPAGRYAQMLEEVWRALRDGFYDPGLHLANWTAVGERYRARLGGCATREELSDLIRMMGGELNASHLGESAAPLGRAGTGWLGARFAPVRGGGLRIEAVVEGGPLDRVGATEGDRLLAVDGEPVGADRPLEALLHRAAGRSVELRLAMGRSTRDVRVLTLDREVGVELEEEERARHRAAETRQRSDESCAYLRLARLDGAAVARFERELYEQAARPRTRGLLLDLRGNPGGHGHESVMDLFLRRGLVRERARGGNWSTSPALRWEGPLVVLIDETTGSAAELLAESLRRTGRGTLVGRETFGGAISTDEISLVDGSRVRIPRIGWSTLEGENIENRGVKPDIGLEYRFEEGVRENDPVLRAGLRTLLEHNRRRQETR